MLPDTSSEFSLANIGSDTATASEVTTTPFASGYPPAALTATALAKRPHPTQPAVHKTPTPFASGYPPAALTATALAKRPHPTQPAVHKTPTPFASGYPPAALTATALAKRPHPTQPAVHKTPTPFASGYPPAALTATALAKRPHPTPTPFASGYPPVALTATALAKRPHPTPTPHATGYPPRCTTTHITNQSQTISGVLVYTRYNILQDGKVINTPDNVKQVPYTYTNGKFTLSTASTITTLTGADGVITLPDGSLIVGGEGSIWKINPNTGAKQMANPGGSVLSDHVAYDNQKNIVWTSGDNPLTTLSKIPLTPFADGTPIQLKGDDTKVTQVAFDGFHNAYYTSSDIRGNGSFGVIDLTTFTTKRKFSNLPAAHGITYDPLSGTLILSGANHITQIDPKTLTIISDWTAPTQYPLTQFDQDTIDGLGHLWAASNDGNLVFIDYSKTRKIAAPTNYVSIQHLDTNLDDITFKCLSN